ncbi:type II toxin-antitoxin system RelE/ParE family toxin [Vibrio tasmaniensis]|uniref:type II toxin-antitoxin system RelE/ParE family toxin n=1 Tax=Vibrio tasmaniensis TaxID=212663 RepID=UPI0003112AE0|nr:type II toxin-antitoxin system RelE/ParE family toxin [Vibrio tasmaniensis]
MTHYKLSSAAQSDLIEIRRYTLERWGQAQWTTYFSELKQSMELLANNKLLGIEVSEVGQNYFHFPQPFIDAFTYDFFTSNSIIVVLNN